MNLFKILCHKLFYISPRDHTKPFWVRFHLDFPLLTGLILITVCGLFILYSAANQNAHLVDKQAIRLGLAFLVMLIFANISPETYRSWAPRVFVIGILFLIAVLAVGHVGKGAQRWLNLGLFRFQPSEIMKIGVPLILAWYLSERPLPPSKSDLGICGLLILIPVLLTAKQPDLGTGILLFIAGASVLLLAGMSWRLIFSLLILTTASLPFLWHFMRDYQRQRVLTFFNPERDPLGSGYHIIQSKIAIGSGGIFGTGWLNGTQSQLHFLPEHATDFIFAVTGEEFGMIGALSLLAIYLFVFARGIYIATQAKDSFSRLLVGGLSLTFFISVFINIGMVTGILPVVGLPLPLVSYGGTSMVTFMASMGIIMSIHTHKKLLTY